MLHLRVPNTGVVQSWKLAKMLKAREKEQKKKQSVKHINCEGLRRGKEMAPQEEEAFWNLEFYKD